MLFRPLQIPHLTFPLLQRPTLIELACAEMLHCARKTAMRKLRRSIRSALEWLLRPDRGGCSAPSNQVQKLRFTDYLKVVPLGDELLGLAVFGALVLPGSHHRKILVAND